MPDSPLSNDQQSIINNLGHPTADDKALQTEIAKQQAADTKTAPEPKADEQEPKVNDRLVKLALKEKAIREREQAWKTKQAETEKTWADKLEAAEAKAAQYEKEKAELDAYLNGENLRTKAGLQAFLERTGIDFTALSKAYLGLSDMTPEEKRVKALEDKINAYEQDRAAKEKAATEAQQKEAFQTKYQADCEIIKGYLATQLDTYELTNDLGDQGIQAVVNKTYATLRELKAGGHDISTWGDDQFKKVIDYCANEVETNLYTQAQAIYPRLAKLKKMVAMGITTNLDQTGSKGPSDSISTPTQSQVPNAEQIVKELSAPKPKPKFLTNDMTAGSTPTAIPSKGNNAKLEEDRRIAEAVAQWEKANPDKKARR